METAFSFAASSLTYKNGDCLETKIVLLQNYQNMYRNVNWVHTAKCRNNSRKKSRSVKRTAHHYLKLNVHIA